MTFIQIYEWGRVEPNGKATITPCILADPTGAEIPVRHWADLLFRTADWLVQEGLLTESDCPVSVGRMHARYLIHETPYHPNRAEFQYPWRLSNGLYLEHHFGGKQIARFCKPLVEKFGQDPAQFRVWLR